MDKNQMKQTKFDSMVTNPTMQLVKAVIPYIDNPIGTYLGIFIKFRELQNAAIINNNVSIAAMNADKHRGMENMLEDILDFMDDDMRETFESLKGMMDMMETMNGMDMGDDMMNAFMGSAFGGNADFSTGENNDTSFVGNATSVFGENNETSFEKNDDSAFDNSDDVTSSQMNYEKGLDDYE